MSRIYITGHKNPDLDSICAAVAYADLKNQTDTANQYIPIRCGSMNRAAKSIFKRLGLESPLLMKDVSPQVRDIAKRDIVTLDENAPVLEAIKELDAQTISLIPVFNRNQEFRGILSIREITRFLIADNLQSRPVYDFLTANFQSVLPGYFYKRGKQSEFVAPIMTGAMPMEISLERIKKLGDSKPILVTGLREDLLEQAVKDQFPAIILTGLDRDRPIPVDMEKYEGTIFVSRSDTAETIRLLRLSTPVKNVMDADPPRLDSSESFDRAKTTLLDSSLRGLPVFQGEHFEGIVTRRCFIERPRPRLILVDHNELSQSVEGADQAEILEIQDHHRLGIIKTREPIFCFSRPVGSTCTIIYGHYKRYQLEPSREMATLMLSGLLSDTVQLKSPTTTVEDRKTAEELAALAETTVEELGTEIFSHNRSLTEQSPEEQIFSDYKEYSEGNLHCGIGQIETNGFEEIPQVLESYRKCMERELKRRNLHWLMVLITHVGQGNSRLICTEFPPGEQRLPYKQLQDGLFDLPGILSRKKQLLPEVLRILEELENR